MSTALEQRLPRGVHATSVGLKIADDASIAFDAYISLGKRLAGYVNASGWAIGDWAEYGEWEYGSRYAEAIEATGLEYGTIATLKWLAGKFEISRRRENLSLNHHREVAPLSVHEQENWLDRAESEGLSVMRLREAVRESKALPSPAPTFTPVHVRPTSTEQQLRWQNAAAKAGLELAAWAARVLDEAAGA